MHIHAQMPLDSAHSFRSHRPIWQAYPLCRWFRNCSLLLLLLPWGLQASGNEKGLERSVQFLFGQYTTGNTGESWNPFAIEHEPNYLIGLSGAQDFWVLGKGFFLGAEAGTGLRVGEDPGSTEIWVGPRIRHKGFQFGKSIRLSFSCSTGISWVSGAIGTEAERVQRRNGDSEWLFYLGPDLSFSLAQYPDWELFYRLHHRSGANETLGGLTEGHNANAIGIRRKF